MTRLQSLIVGTTLVVCLCVGLLASQRNAPEESADGPDSFAPLVTAVDADAVPPVDFPDVIPAVANEPAVSPRKLTADDAAPVTDHPVRRTIDRLMPNASQEERQIWFEELRGLPVSAVEDLLRLRKESNAASPLRESPDALPSVDVDLPLSMSRGMRQYRALLVQNLLNVDTPGYRAGLIDQLARPLDAHSATESPTLESLHFGGTRIDTRTGEIRETGRPLDLAIHTAGWFVVEDEHGQPACTRHGALQMNAERELTLPAIPERRPLSPRVQIPEKTAHIFIDTNGVIYGGTELSQWDTEQPLGQISLARFLDDSALVLHQDGLYRPTPAAGAMSRLTPEQQSNALRSGALEHSNVQRKAQAETLERLEQALERRVPKMPSSQKTETDSWD